MKTLETERLILRKWQETDLDDFYEYAKAEGVGEMAGWPHHTDKKVTEIILKGFIEEDEVYAVVQKEDNKVIGSLGLHKRAKDENYKADTQRELGYVISKQYWGKGFAVEASKEAIKYAFEDLDVDVLWCSHAIFNNQSCRVIEKCGFEFYSEGTYEAKLLDKVYEEKVYLMTKEQYKNLCDK